MLSGLMSWCHLAQASVQSFHKRSERVILPFKDYAFEGFCQLCGRWHFMNGQDRSDQPHHTLPERDQILAARCSRVFVEKLFEGSMLGILKDDTVPFVLFEATIERDDIIQPRSGACAFQV